MVSCCAAFVLDFVRYFLDEVFWYIFITLSSFAYYRDRAKKDKAIAKLRRKALEKNPDEFTRKMIVTRMKVTSLS